jgi:tetratricopeptide (TPR) repeat protein
MRWLLIPLIFIATFALYQVSWSNVFVLDDLTKIQENSDLRIPFEWHNFVYPYGENKMHFRNDPSRPLTFMIYWACYQVGKGKVEPFHIVSTAVHAGCAALLALLVLQLTGLIFGERSHFAALVASGLFLTSPLMAGTVVYAFGLSDLLCAFFAMAVMVVLVGRKSPSWLRVLVGCVLYILALGSKQAGVVVPVLLVAIDYFVGQWKVSGRWRAYIPLTLLTVAYLLTRYFYFGGIGDLEGRDETVPALVYAAAEGVIIFKYLALTIWPFGLAIDHQPRPEDFTLIWMALAWIAIAALAVASVRAKTAVAKTIALGWIFFLVCMLPTSSIMPTVDLMVERRAYLADIGIFMAVGILLWRLALNQRWLVVILGSAAIVGQTALALDRAQVYGSVERLWRESLVERPDNPRALINLGVYYSSVEKWDEGRKTLEDLLKIWPNNGAVYSKLAYIYHQPKYAGHNDLLAWNYYQKALELTPNNIFALYNVGVYLMEQGKNREAEEYFMRAVHYSPQMTKSLVAAGQAAWADGGKDRARGYFKKALEIDPTLEVPRRYLEQ